MSEKSCTACKYLQPSRVYRSEGGCYRQRRYQDGLITKAPLYSGWSIASEAGSIHLVDNRLPEDHCGPERRHFVGAV